jgi:hypothetical protein
MPETVQLLNHAHSCVTPGKPPRFGEVRKARVGNDNHHKPTSSPSSVTMGTPNSRMASLYGQSSFVSEAEGYHSFPNTPEVQCDPSGHSAFDNAVADDLTPSSLKALEVDMAAEDATIQQQTQALYDCIKALEAQLRCKDAGIRPASHCDDSHPPSCVVQPAHVALSDAESWAKATSGGTPVVVTGAVVYDACMHVGL